MLETNGLSNFDGTHGFSRGPTATLTYDGITINASNTSITSLPAIEEPPIITHLGQQARTSRFLQATVEVQAARASEGAMKEKFLHAAGLLDVGEHSWAC